MYSYCSKFCEAIGLLLNQLFTWKIKSPSGKQTKKIVLQIIWAIVSHNI
jgi:hypothetical protein